MRIRRPAFTLAAVMTLALGMGVNALMFSVTNGLLFRPLPFNAADELVWIFGEERETPGRYSDVSGEEGDALARSASAFTATAAIGDSGLVRELERTHDRWSGIWATASLFDVLRVAPVFGAVPGELPADGAPRAIFISEERWTRDFSRDPSVVGRVLDFADNKKFVVAGVLPRGLEFPFARVPQKGNGAGFKAGVQDYWILAPARPGEHPGGVMIGRISHGRTIDSVSVEVASLAASLPSQHQSRSIVVISLRDHVLGMLRPALPLLQLFAALVLVLACANLANLMLARAAATEAETVTRIALGARPTDLARLFASEAALISTLGAALGLAIAWAGRAAIAASAPGYGAVIDRIVIDGAVVGFLAVVSIGTTLLFAVVPVLIRPRKALGPALMASSRQTRPGVQRPLWWLVVAQVAMSLTLLVGALTLRTSLHRLMTVDAGYDASGVISAQTTLYLPTQAAQPILHALVDRLRATANVEAVGFVHSAPLTGRWTVRDTFEVMEGPRRGVTPEMPGSFVAYDFFEVMRTPVLAGRTFSATDLTTPDYPILINDVAANTFFPGTNPVGQRVRMTGRLREIVGVVKATRDLSLDSAPEPQWYQPGFSGTAELVVRVSGRAFDHVSEISRVITSADPRFIIERIGPLDAIVAGTVLERRLASHLVTAFAVLALLLAAVGISAVMHFVVVERRREFGLRAALGATRGDLMRLTVRHGVTMTATGLAVGITANVLLAGALEGLLFETRGASPLVIASAALVLFTTAIAVCLRPAWRAASVDAAVTLKAD